MFRSSGLFFVCIEKQLSIVHCTLAHLNHTGAMWYCYAISMLKIVKTKNIITKQNFNPFLLHRNRSCLLKITSSIRCNIFSKTNHNALYKKECVVIQRTCILYREREKAQCFLLTGFYAENRARKHKFFFRCYIFFSFVEFL